MSTVPVAPTVSAPRWEPTKLPTGILPVRQDLVTKYMDLFVNQRSYAVQSPWGQHSYYRPRWQKLWKASRAQAAGSLALYKTDEHQDKAKELYAALIAERNLPEYMPMTENTIARHMGGHETINLFAINPENQSCKWMAIDADYEMKKAQTDLAKLRDDLLDDGVVAVQEESRRGGHLWIFCHEPLLAKQCRLFIYNTALRMGVPIKGKGFDAEGIEIFPKQDFLEPGQLGNALRGPLGVHRKDDNRYWFEDLEHTLEAQIEYLVSVPKLTALQLDDLTLGMDTPPQFVEPEPVPYRRHDGTRAKAFDIRKVIAEYQTKPTIRAGKEERFQCPSCAQAGGDKHRDNLTVCVKGKKEGQYRCLAGCDTNMIRRAFGYGPSTYGKF